MGVVLSKKSKIAVKQENPATKQESKRSESKMSACKFISRLLIANEAGDETLSDSELYDIVKAEYPEIKPYLISACRSDINNLGRYSDMVREFEVKLPISAHKRQKPGPEKQKPIEEPSVPKKKPAAKKNPAAKKTTSTRAKPTKKKK